MKKSEFTEKIKAIGTCEDDVQRRTLLAELEEDAAKDYDELERLGTENQTLTTANEGLRDANMKLFLRVGESKTEEQRKKDETGIETEKKNKRKFEDLFDEKGDIK